MGSRVAELDLLTSPCVTQKSWLLSAWSPWPSWSWCMFAAVWRCPLSKDHRTPCLWPRATRNLSQLSMGSTEIPFTDPTDLARGAMDPRDTCPRPWRFQMFTADTTTTDFIIIKQLSPQSAVSSLYLCLKIKFSSQKKKISEKKKKKKKKKKK